MADAGRILIMPKGTYDTRVSYEMLDMVFHNDVSWIAKKPVIGVEPSDANSAYWARMTGDATWRTELDKIVDGTTPVGNADTVDGKHADDFLLRDGSVPMSGDFKIQKHNNGYTQLVKNHGADADYGTILRDYDGTNAKTQIVLRTKTKELRYERYDSDNTLLEKYDILHTGNMAKHVLPLTGGTISGVTRFTTNTPLTLGSLGSFSFNLRSDGTNFLLQNHDNKTLLKADYHGNIETSGDITLNKTGDNSRVIASNDKGKVSLIMRTDGSFGIWDYTINNFLIARNANGTLNMVGKTPLHTGNSAKVLVQSTPLTEDGAIRVW